jgi:hypothetical protein
VDIELNSTQQGPLSSPSEGLNPAQTLLALNMILAAVEAAADATYERVRAMADASEDVLSECPDSGSNADSVVLAYRKVVR